MAALIPFHVVFLVMWWIGCMAGVSGLQTAIPTSSSNDYIAKVFPDARELISPSSFTQLRFVSGDDMG